MIRLILPLLLCQVTDDAAAIRARIAIELALQQQKPAAAIASHTYAAPWLPASSQVRYRRMWETAGVPWIDGLKFYDMPQAYQQSIILTSNGFRGSFHGATSLGRASDETNTRFPWDVPAGLDNSPRDQWTRVRAARIPAAITHWTDATPYSDLPLKQTNWSYPEGTVFAEILIRRISGRELPFEIRVREKLAGGKWDDGTAYRPFATVASLPASAKAEWRTITHAGLRDAGHGSDSVDVKLYDVSEVPLAALASLKLNPSRIVARSKTTDSLFPTGYTGPPLSCSKCHSASDDGPQYSGGNLRRRDTIFSFHIFDPKTIDSGAYTPALNQSLNLKAWGNDR